MNWKSLKDSFGIPAVSYTHLDVYKRQYLCNDKVVEPKFRISPNTELKNSVQYMGNIEHKGSIENMKNSVKVKTDTDVMTTLKAEESISKYGFLQEVRCV